MSDAAWMAPQWEQRLRAAGLTSPAELLERGPQELGLAGRWEALTKPGLGGRQRWRWELPADGAEGSVLYVKRYDRSSLKAQWDRILRQSARHSRAWWEFYQGRRLADAYVPVPDPVAYAESLHGWLERRSVVLLEAVPGDGLDRAWMRLSRQRAPITRGLARHDLAVRVGRFASAIHQSGLCHRDLYLCHVFADLDPAGGRVPTFTLIDLARAIRPRVRRMRWILKDLSQLDSSARQIGASRSDRLRCLQAYLGLEQGAPRLRWYARRIVRKSNWILRRMARQGGPA